MEDEKSRPMSTKIEPVLRDLEALLRQELGNSLVVENFTTSNLLPPGENYGSTMFRVEAEVKHDGPKSESKKLSLIAKMLSPTMYQKVVFRDISSIFRKEIYMYTVIAPAYNILQSDCGISETEVFKFPKYYGSRLSMEEAEDKIDNDAVILMENLKLKNYTCGDRRIGLDLAHTRSAVEALARFHALGVAVKIKRPQLFEEFKIRARSTKLKKELTTKVAQFITNNVQKIPELLPYLNRIEKVLFRSNSDFFRRVSVEPWGTLIHADLTLLNVMFRDDAGGNPEDIRIIDFQDYRYRNPLRDLVFFLFTSCQTEVRIDSIEDLIDSYYQMFILHLTRLKCDVKLFSRESFNEHLAYAANLEYTHTAFIPRLLLSNSTAGLVFKVEASDEYRERLAEISLRFIKENWI